MALDAISSLVVYLSVLPIPARAAASSPEALYALNNLQTAGAAGTEYGRFYDAGAHRAWRTDLEAATLEAAPALTPRLAKRTTGAVPFVLDVPVVPPAPFQRTFHRLLARKETNGYDELIHSYAERLGLDPRLVKAVIAAESEFTARAKSPAGALGLMQVMPATADFMGISGKALFNPEANIRAGTLYLAYLYQRAWKRYHLRGVPFSRAPTWLVQRIVAAYNAGPRFLNRRRLYTQTREYVKKVLLFYKSKVTELRPAA